MKKMGFSKKSEGDDDSNRAGLFGRKKSPPQDANPYAQQPAEDPYAKMTPYQQARAGLPGGPRPGAAGGLPGGPRPGGAGLPSGPGPRGGYGTPPPPYSGNPKPSGGYGSEKVGASGGYGANRYDTNDAPPYSSNQRPPPATSQPGARVPARGPGGYGGLGRVDSTATDDNRDALFSGAQTRVAQRSQAPDGDRYGQSGATGDTYDGYGEQRELTEEEQEKEDVRNMGRQIRDVRQESVRTLDRSLALADQAIETSLGTYARLGAQSERLYNTEKNLDLAANQSKIASEKASELKTLNRSMFAVHISNPFTSTKRAAERDQQVLDRHRSERDQRQSTRQDAFAASQRMESSFRDLNRPQLLGLPKTSAAERSKHMFVDDDDDPELAAEDERDEEAIDSKLSDLHGRVGMLNTIGRRMGEEVDQQIVHIDRIGGKSDMVDDSVRMNREQLNRIR
ncbi:hypothetical protein QBC33DRAFT_606766 [Phialemonium atrogriseum]|uniref:t-SNARE coiled-coil homology domain-containing protein n=1 Tax=Phialemonium atrogriseum TaxID=1093897 RepID=A0AAJ0FI28_9PEZI|nr:uncharacterized protein QBC33DRAFT_606766 [Phialemonium atrogriseum]KAK1768342.1 hypothetical protein QBC33DRAFT_606766 [Phialemonium atrogriseum]